MNEIKIINQLSQKTATGFDTPYFIGSEARFVTGTRNANVNNIEEQLLIGEDCMVYDPEQLEDGRTKSIIEYHDGTKVNDYYVLEVYEYGEDAKKPRQYYKEEGILCVPDDNSDNEFIGEDMFHGKSTLVYKFSEDGSLVINSDIIGKAESLKFKDKNNKIINVADKYYCDVVLQGGRKAQKRVIKNYLLDD